MIHSWVRVACYLGIIVASLFTHDWVATGIAFTLVALDVAGRVWTHTATW